MSSRQHSIAWLALTAVALAPGDAQGCWLTQWLFGRHHQPVVAGYPPVVANYAPVAANYAPPTASAATLAPEYSLQRPAYVDNVNLYTGLPPAVAARPALPATTTAPAPFMANRPLVGSPTPSSTALPIAAGAQVPIARRFRGAATTSNPFYGTGNVYPNNYSAPAYTSAYPTTAAAGVAPVSATAVPATPVAPVYPVAPQPRRGGLARFFGSLLGTRYRSSYYPAPVTYYRPATTIDPVSGTNVTVQRPCSSSVQLLQRTPVRTLSASPPTNLAPAPTTVTPAPSMLRDPCATIAPTTATPGYSPAPATSAPMAPPAGSFAPQPAPSVQPRAGVTSPSDLAPVEEPRIESTRRPLTQEDYNGNNGYGNGRNDGKESSTNENGPDGLGDPRGGDANGENGANGGSGSYYRRQSEAADESGQAGWQRSGTRSSSRQSSLQVARPIPVPDDFRSPFPPRPATHFERPSSGQSSLNARQRSEPLSAPELPPASFDRSRPSSDYQPSLPTESRRRSSTPALEASLIRTTSGTRSAKRPTNSRVRETQRKPESDWYVPAR